MTAIVDQLADLTRSFKARLREGAAGREASLPPFQARIVAFFARHPGGSPLALAQGTGSDKAQVARALKELEGRGLLRREPDPQDRRAARLFLSETGEALAARLLHERAALAQRMLAPLDETERATLSALLAKMRQGLEAP